MMHDAIVYNLITKQSIHVTIVIDKYGCSKSYHIPMSTLSNVFWLRQELEFFNSFAFDLRKSIEISLLFSSCMLCGLKKWDTRYISIYSLYSVEVWGVRTFPS